MKKINLYFPDRIIVKDRLPAGFVECPPTFAPERYMACSRVEGREITRTGSSKQEAVDNLRKDFPTLRKVRIV